MKRSITYIGIGAAALIAVLLLAGCFWTPDGGTGSITMDLGSLRDAKTINSSADTVRIYLQQEASGSYFAFEGTSLYIQEAIPDAVEGERTLTIEGIPSGNWLLVVAAGATVDNGGFYPLNYGVVETAISAGTDNPVTMELGVEPPFNIAENLVGKEINGAVEFGGNVFAFDAENETLYSGPDESNMTEVSGFSAALSGYTVYSIDKGYVNAAPPGNDAVWINTDKGIVLFDGAFNTSFQTTEFPVRESGGFYDDTGVSELYVYYRLPNGFGGADYDSGNWYKYDEFDEYFTGNFIRQFFVDELTADSNTYAYFATSLGAFRVNSVNLSTEIDNFIVEAKFFEVASGGAIYGLAYKHSEGIVLATESGLFVGDLDATSVVTGAQRIANTEGINFTRVAVTYDGSNTYIAALDDKADLYLFKEYAANTYEMKKFPFYTGFPGGVSQMMFLPAPSASILYISGEGKDFASGGFVKVDVASAQIDWDN